jgi:hypothetical protein
MAPFPYCGEWLHCLYSNFFSFTFSNIMILHESRDTESLDCD